MIEPDAQHEQVTPARWRRLPWAARNGGAELSRRRGRQARVLLARGMGAGSTAARVVAAILI